MAGLFDHCYSRAMTKSPPMTRASAADRDYFARIARANHALDDDRVPATLDEMFDRLDRIRRLHGSLAQPGIQGPQRDELDGQLQFLAHLHAVLRRGTNRA